MIENSPNGSVVTGGVAAENVPTPAAVSPTSRLTPFAPAPHGVQKVDLSLAVLPAVEEQHPVRLLGVRELSGIGSTFTSNVADALCFLGLIWKPEGAFETQHHILGGPLLKDSRVLRLAKRIVFVPSFDWHNLEPVLLPIKLTSHGQRVFLALQKLAPQFPNFRTFIYWNGRRHDVIEVALSDAERETILSVVWPTRDEVLDALQASAFDNLDALAAANENVRTLLAGREVI